MRQIRRFLYSWIDKRFLGGCSNYNTLALRKSCRSKKQARDMFAQNGIPHAQGEIFFGPLKPFRFVRRYGFPVVIKPDVSGFSRGSHFPINSFKELLKALLLVKIWWPISVIEQYLQGKNYRVVVIKNGNHNEIMSAIRRYPPFVVGDGSTTIADLIDEENDERCKMGLYPTIHPIEKNSRISGFLRKKNLSFTSVPASGEVVTLYNRISLAPGGVIETLEKESIHEENKELVLKILSLFGANILGIDVIFEKGIEISYAEQKVIFLEVNSRPYLKMHDFPRYGRKENLQPYYDLLNRLDIEGKDIF